MPDKSKRTKVDGLAFLFDVTRIENTSYFKSFKISIPENRIDDLLSDNLLTKINVFDNVQEILPEIQRELEIILPSMKPEMKRIPVTLTKDCFKCDYDTLNEEYAISGYDECWKGLPHPEYHIKDITRIGSNSKSIRQMDSLISKGKLSYDDLLPLLGTGDSDLRRKIQIEYTKKNEEYFDKDLKAMVKIIPYPLHFIDFEATRVALPYHQGMRPYEQVAFQWSCHTIRRRGDEPIHGEWLNLEPEFPNFKFAEALMEHIEGNGGTGTPLMWSSFENTTLRDIFIQMKQYEYSNPRLENWLSNIVQFRNRRDENILVPDNLCSTEGRFVDLEKLAKKYYFHPAMKGKTSIKWVLPAVLKCLEKIDSDRIKNWLTDFRPGVNLYGLDNHNTPVDPYKLLPALGFGLQIYEEAENLSEAESEDQFVNEGTGAMRAYEDLMIGLKKGDTKSKAIYSEALLRYCQLDTLAMLIIWEYWAKRD